MADMNERGNDKIRKLLAKAFHMGYRTPYNSIAKAIMEKNVDEIIYLFKCLQEDTKYYLKFLGVDLSKYRPDDISARLGVDEAKDQILYEALKILSPEKAKKIDEILEEE